MFGFHEAVSSLLTLNERLLWLSFHVNETGLLVLWSGLPSVEICRQWVTQQAVTQQSMQIPRQSWQKKAWIADGLPSDHELIIEVIV